MLSSARLSFVNGLGYTRLGGSVQSFCKNVAGVEIPASRS
jgi:hypothetical protein